MQSHKNFVLLVWAKSGEGGVGKPVRGFEIRPQRWRPFFSVSTPLTEIFVDTFQFSSNLSICTILVLYLSKTLFKPSASIGDCTNISCSAGNLAECYVPIRARGTAHPHNPRTTNTDRTDPLPGIKTFFDQFLFLKSSQLQVRWGGLPGSVHTADALHRLDRRKHFLRSSLAWNLPRMWLKLCWKLLNIWYLTE